MNRSLYLVTICVLMLAAAGIAAGSPASAQGQALTSTPAWEPAEEDAPTVEPSVADEPTAIAQRLFAAVLDRPPSGLELEQAARQIDGGQLDQLVDTLVGSSEYRRQRASLSPRALLEQYYEALLDRAPDASALTTYGAQLERGADGAVIRALLASSEFDEVVASQTLAASGLESACMKTVADRVSADRRRPTNLRFLTIATVTDSFITKEMRGTARIADGSLIEFECTSERLRNSIIDASYRQVDETVRSARIVRCESIDGRRRECPADTSGGVALVRQLSRTVCQQNVNWGFDERGVWVERGCRGDFRVMEADETSRPLELRADGWGFLRQTGSQPVPLAGVSFSCASDGAFRLTATGGGDVALAGRCYRMDETHFELALDAAPGDWHSGGAGSITVDGDEIVEVSIAGRSRFGQPFSLAFVPEPAPIEAPVTQSGSGLLELADGRRASISALRVEPGANGRVTLVFDGQTRFAFSGTWFQASSGTHQLLVDGGLSDAAISGAGTIRFSPSGVSSLRLTGSAPSVGGPFRLTFEAD